MLKMDALTRVRPGRTNTLRHFLAACRAAMESGPPRHRMKPPGSPPTRYTRRSAFPCAEASFEHAPPIRLGLSIPGPPDLPVPGEFVCLQPASGNRCGTSHGISALWAVPGAGRIWDGRYGFIWKRHRAITPFPPAAGACPRAPVHRETGSPSRPFRTGARFAPAGASRPGRPSGSPVGTGRPPCPNHSGPCQE